MILLLKRFWPYLAVIALLAGLWGWHRLEVRQARAEGVRSEKVAQKAREDAATAKHNAKLKRVNDANAEELSAVRAAADYLRAHPVIRTIRVPVASVCPPPSDAVLSAAGDPQPQFLELPDTDFVRLESWLIRAAAGSIEISR